MTDAATRNITKQLDEVTECPICNETFTDPRLLPCVHTYCLLCLEQYCSKWKHGDAVPCPMCRKAFTIPVGGVRTLPKNFFLEQLKTISKMSAEHVPDIESARPRLAGVVRSAGYNPVRGVALLDGQLYVVRQPTRQNIEVYDATTFSLRRHIVATGFGDYMRGLAACPVNRCLYASDWLNKFVHRIDLELVDTAGSYLLDGWQVENGPVGLSVTGASTVLVTCWGLPAEILEFTTDGDRLRKIILEPQINVPWHAVELVDGNFAVSHGWGEPLHRVCIVNGAGRVTAGHGNKSGARAGQLKQPMHLVVSKSGFILVADRGNNRVLVLSSTLACARVLPLPSEGGLHGPFSLYLDESRDRLYVGEGDASSILVVDHVGKYLNELV